MNVDYEIEFRFACKQEPAALDKLLDQFITVVEQARSFAGGGCDSRGGEFYIETGRHVSSGDVLAMLAVWLPHTARLSVKAVEKEKVASPAGSARNGARGRATTRARNTKAQGK